MFEHLSSSKPLAIRLFCFPYAGGSADLYRNWQRWVPKQVGISLVHLPGHGRNIGQRPFSRLLSLVNLIADAMVNQTTVPYAFFGHSMGGLISFELAHELLRRSGLGPRHLFISGRPAPHWRELSPPKFNLPHELFLAELKKLNGTPQEVLDHPELMALFLEVLRADFEAVETYEYRPTSPLPCSITVYSGLDDVQCPVESCYAWQQQTSATCKVTMFNGDHFFIRSPTQEFIAALQNDLLAVI
jgi:medium-chain acyl-[acyl-carrier-protein] hydrolase